MVAESSDTPKAPTLADSTGPSFGFDEASSLAFESPVHDEDRSARNTTPAAKTIVAPQATSAASSASKGKSPPRSLLSSGQGGGRGLALSLGPSWKLPRSVTHPETVESKESIWAATPYILAYW